MNKKLLIPILALTLFGASCWTQSVNVNTTAAVNQNGNANAAPCTTTVGGVAYTGQAGKNALELLQIDHRVDVSAEGFVNAIDGQKPGDRQFWAFYVNCTQANVGAKDYQTKDQDFIEWRLESF